MHDHRKGGIVLQEAGKDTKLQSGDELLFDVDNHTAVLLRNGKPILQENGDNCYYIMPSDGTEFKVLANLIADVAGLHAHKSEEDDSLRYIFRPA